MANYGIKRACEDTFRGRDVYTCINTAERVGASSFEIRRCRGDYNVSACIRRQARGDRYGRGNGRGNGGYNGGGYGGGSYPPAPRTVVETFTVSPDRYCLRNLRPVNHADDLVSDGFFSRFVGQLASCESRRDDSAMRYDANCTKVNSKSRTDYRCVDRIKDLVKGGTITYTHESFFEMACSDYIYSCTRTVY